LFSRFVAAACAGLPGVRNTQAAGVART